MAGAITDIAWTDSTSAPVTSISLPSSPFGSNTEAGCTLVAFVWAIHRTNGTWTVSGGAGASWVERGTRLRVGSVTMAAFTAENVTGGDDPIITCSFSGAGEDSPAMVVMRVTGLQSTSNYLSFAAANDTSVSGADSISAGSMSWSGTAFCVAAIQNDNTDGTPTAGTGFTNYADTGWGYGGTHGGRVIYATSQSSPKTMIASPGGGSTASHTIFALALLESGGGGGGTPIAALSSNFYRMLRGN